MLVVDEMWRFILSCGVGHGGGLRRMSDLVGDGPAACQKCLSQRAAPRSASGSCTLVLEDVRYVLFKMVSLSTVHCGEGY